MHAPSVQMWMIDMGVIGSRRRSRFYRKTVVVRSSRKIWIAAGPLALGLVAPAACRERSPAGPVAGAARMAGAAGVALAPGAGAAPGAAVAPGAVVARGLLPEETVVVVAIDARRLREAPLWDRLAALAGDGAADRRIVDDFARATGFDPLRDVERVTLAFPAEARATGAFVAIVEGAHLDEARIVAYARKQVELQGGRLERRELPRAGRPSRALWTWGTGAAVAVADAAAGGRPPGGTLEAFFLGTTAVVLAGGGWGSRAADLADAVAGARGLPSDGRVARWLAAETARAGLFVAAEVPEDMRADLRDLPDPGAVASLTGGTLAIDLAPDLTIDATLETATPAAAAALARDALAHRDRLRANPTVALLGLGGHLDGFSARADGNVARVRVRLTPQQTEDLANRVAGLAQSVRAGVGGLGALPGVGALSGAVQPAAPTSGKPRRAASAPAKAPPARKRSRP